jgi:hypothetical protein
LFQFAKYPISQTEFLAEMVKRKDILGSIRFTAANLLFLGTAGKALGLDYSDMFPKFRFGVPPTLQAPWEASKAITNAPDKYGNTSEDPNPITRVLGSKGVQKGLMNYVPAGNQISKTVGNLLDVQKGGSYTPSGRKRFDVNPSIKGAVLGSYSTPEGQEYINNLTGKNLSPEEKEAREINKKLGEESNRTSKLANSHFNDLKNAGNSDNRKALIAKWKAEGTWTPELKTKLGNLVKKRRIEKIGGIAVTVNSIQTTKGRAVFLKSFMKSKSVAERKLYISRLKKAGLWTKALRRELTRKTSFSVSSL